MGAHIPKAGALAHDSEALGFDSVGIDNLARGLFWQPGEVILMVWAYYDESGIFEDGELKSLTMGCCVSQLEKWVIFEREWKDCLSRYGLDVFHMTDFEAWQKPFDFKLQDGSRDKEKHNNILNELLEIILSAVEGMHGYTSTSIVQAGVNSHKEYFQDCINGAVKNAVLDTFDIYKKQINLVFDRQNHFPQSGTDFYVNFYDYGEAKDRIGDVSVSCSEKKVALQAADLVAYEMARCQRPSRPERYPFRKLCDGAKERNIRMTLSYGPLRTRELSFGK